MYHGSPRRARCRGIVGVGIWQSAHQFAATAPAGVMRVETAMADFQPNRIVAHVGKPVRIELVNIDNQNHAHGGG